MKAMLLTIIASAIFITETAFASGQPQMALPKQEIATAEEPIITIQKEEPNIVNILSTGENKEKVEIRPLELREKLLVALREAHTKGRDLDITEDFINRLTDEQLQMLVSGEYGDITEVSMELAKEDMSQENSMSDEEIKQEQSLIDRLKGNKGKLIAIAALMSSAGLATRIPKYGEDERMDEIKEKFLTGTEAQEEMERAYWQMNTQEEESTNEEAIEKAKSIINDLKTSNGFYANEGQNKLTCIVTDGNYVNGCCAQNGTMIVTEKALELQRDEAAAFMAHEAGHYAKKHSENKARACLMAEDLGKEDLKPYNTLMTEYDADAYGFYLAAENFNPGGQLALFYNKEFIKEYKYGLETIKNSGQIHDHPEIEQRRERSLERLKKYSENRVDVEKVSQKESRVIVDGKVVWEGNHEKAALKAGEYAKEFHGKQ